MEFNRIVSLALGFIVLVLVFVWIGSRFRSSTTDTANKPTISITPIPTKKPEGGSWNPLGFLFGGTSPTPSVRVTSAITPTIIVATGNNSESSIATTTSVPTQIVYQNNNTGQTSQYTVSSVQEIPQTGAATILLPLSLSLFSAGVYLKRKTS